MSITDSRVNAALRKLNLMNPPEVWRVLLLKIATHKNRDGTMATKFCAYAQSPNNFATTGEDVDTRLSKIFADCANRGDSDELIENALTDELSWIIGHPLTVDFGGAR